MTPCVSRIDSVVLAVTNGQVSAEGSPTEAENYGITPDIVFVRRDGWRLGARIQDEQAAYDLWGVHWIRKVDLRNGTETDLTLPQNRG